MAEKYNLKQELINANDYISGKYDNDPKWETLLGASFLTRPDYINTMRANMFTSHIKQALTFAEELEGKVVQIDPLNYERGEELIHIAEAFD